MTALPIETDVLVVGAGPTGLTVALSLMERGDRVTIVDDQAEGRNTSRASVVYPRSLEVLEPFGVAERLAACGIRAQQFTIRDRDRVLMRIPFDRLPTAYPYTLLVSQAVTEATLLQRLGELGGKVWRPYHLTSLREEDNEVSAVFAGGGMIRAKYLVGADGMHSTVRDQAGILFRAGGSGQSYSLADVHLSGGLPRGEVAVYFSPEGQLVTVPYPDGRYKVVAAVADAPLRPGVSFVQGILDARGPQMNRVVVEDIVWSSRFRIHHGVADRFHRGRVVLAGDAAHDNSPLGGQGMNAGICDAVALGAALHATVADGKVDALTAYDDARRRVAHQIVTFTDRLTQLAVVDRRLRGLRNTTLALIGPYFSKRLGWRLSLLGTRPAGGPQRRPGSNR